MENKSWVKLFRKFKEWEWYSDINMSRLFIHLLLSVNFKKKKWHSQTIEKGSLITSYGHLAKDTGLSVQQIRYCLNKLKVTREVTIKTTNKYTLISVNNFCRYQKSNKQILTRVTNKEQTSNKQVTTTKECKEGENGKKVIDTAPLYQLTDKDFEEIATKYGCPMSFVRSKYDDLIGWVEEKPNDTRLRGRVWKMTLMNWVKRDSLKIKQDYAKQKRGAKIVSITTDSS
jgi:hypothetical protein